MKLVRKILFSPITMLFLLVILITSLATATFVENDFGAEVAKLNVYNTTWMEIIFILLSINLLGRIFLLKLYKKAKFTIFLFHLAFVVMVLGAGLTRYFGFEGSMHIREGEESSTLVTNEKQLVVYVDGNQIEDYAEDFTYTNQFKEKVKSEAGTFELQLSQKYSSAYKQAVEDENGSPIIALFLSGETFKGSENMRSGETKNLGSSTLGFNSSNDNEINIISENDSLFIVSKSPIFVSSMIAKAESATSTYKVAFEGNKLYQVANCNLVLQSYYPKAKIKAVPTDIKGHQQSRSALIFTISDGKQSEELTLWDGDIMNSVESVMLGNHQIGMAYGNKTIELPFSLHLDDFEVERYPGSMSPSSFSSRVQLLEKGKEALPFHIYMNNILKHQGYRFYQSSYDQDEQGTILSVNNDRWGTFITYLGYFLMTLGIVLSMLNSNSYFKKTVLGNLKTVVITLLIVAGTTGNIFAQNTPKQTEIKPIDRNHAEQFGKLLIQNNKGRTEPIYTYASELMRKISRKENILGLTPVQLFMEMNMNPEHWINEPIIQISNRELQKHLGLSGKYAAYSDFISNESGYKLQQLVQHAFSKPPKEQSKFDKAIIKTDEKVNICYAIFSGRYLKIFPLPDKKESHTWYASNEASLKVNNAADSLFLTSILPAYFEEVNKARTSDNYATATQFLDGLKTYQKKNSSYELPSDLKTSFEIAYYKYNPLKKLFPFYTTMGVIFLFVLIVFIVLGKTVPRGLHLIFYYIILVAFVLHTLGIADRWYVSGHAPMSNGYESMIFISWVTLLAGFLFNKRSNFALPATAALGGLTLMVANLSFMDPEITNLVPVLQSYWLTIHVSVITASYGFLALGALLGMINLTLIILHTRKNHKHVVETLESLTILNHKTLIAGLYLLTIGTFLGAVWANESWGRYWGWDPKETWALISILVYTIVTHARLIPGIKGIFTFNTLALLGFSTVLMTYFGVNYYLSGLHSYAAGDPVPVPSFVYYSAAAVITLTLGASIKYKGIISYKDESSTR
ncbi:MAG: c-type cytochrome biogenesis protein CcsB [Prolixibacteraceae bacterium]